MATEHFTKDHLPVSAFTKRLDPVLYSPEEEAHIHAIAQDASHLFPIDKVFASIKDLRDEVSLFGHRKGFLVTTQSSKFCCTRSRESTSHKNYREKKIDSGVIPLHERREYRSSIFVLGGG
jgi:hypothetical protein